MKSAIALLLSAAVALSTPAAQLTLTWTDNSDNESGFKIERKQGIGTSVPFEEIGTVGPNVTTFVDTGLLPVMTYSYRVRAYNAAGNSDYSNVASATTSATLLNNGDFESFGTDGTAVGWSVQQAGGVVLTLSGDVGRIGQAQKISVTTTSSWGMFFYQQPPLTLGKTYRWNFWYKTDGASWSASVTNAAHSATVFDLPLPASATWQQVTKIFTYDNAAANQVRLAASVPGSFWIDSMTLVETEAINTPPTISPIGNVTIPTGANSGPLGFVVGDAESSPAALAVTATSSNLVLVPLDGIIVAGTTANRTVTVTPALGQSGSATITLTVSDGTATTATSFEVTVPPPGPPWAPGNLQAAQ